MTENNQTATLPGKLSDLITLALSDLEKVEGNPDYTIKMSHWHIPCRDTCLVCLAGCVMASTLQAPRGRMLGPQSLGETVSAKLLALDCVRTGYIVDALYHLEQAFDEEYWEEYQDSLKLVSYAAHAQLFKDWLAQIANDLREKGL
jgi:hypothetical protein